MGRTAGRFARVEPRRRVKDFVLGLLSDLPRKDCWTIAERAGEQVRRFTSWSRWVTLAMLAHASSLSSVPTNTPAIPPRTA